MTDNPWEYAKEWDLIRIIADITQEATKDVGLEVTHTIIGQRWFVICHNLTEFKVYLGAGIIEIASISKLDSDETRQIGRKFQLADPDCFQKLAKELQRITKNQ